MNFKKVMLGVFAIGLLTGCGGEKKEETKVVSEVPMTLDQIIEAAKKEGEVNSVGMPDAWAN